LNYAPGETYGNGDLGCGVTHNKVDNNSWTVTVTYQQICTPPLPPTANAQEVCAMSPVSNLVATGAAGATFNWYTSATGGSPLSSTATLTAGTYHVSQTVNNCESDRTPVIVTINTVPNPVPATNYTFCAGATVADLEAEGEAGGTIIWSDSAAGIPLAPASPLTSGTYYVFQQLDGCQSSGLPITVTVNAPVVPTADINQTLCYGATVAELSAEGTTGSTIQWSATEGGAILSGDTELEEGSYFVREVIGDCESGWFEVAVFINPEVPVVLTETEQDFCNGSTVAQLYAEGANTGIIQWSLTEGGVILAANAELGSGSYFVRQIIGSGCESDWTEVDVTINTVSVVTTNGNQEFCTGSTVAELFAEGETGAAITWSSTEGGAPLSGTTLLTNGTYYVTQTIGECESIAESVTVVVNAIPDEPGGDDTQEFTIGETIADLEIISETGSTTSWYMYNDLGVLINIPETMVLQDGETYYVSQTINGCESEYLDITVNAVLGTSSFEASSLKVYPNPANDVLNISAKEDITSVILYNLIGQKVLYSKQSNTVNIEKLSAGTYIAEIVTASGSKTVLKIMKQ
jgi:hypothetical protein